MEAPVKANPDDDRSILYVSRHVYEKPETFSASAVVTCIIVSCLLLASLVYIWMQFRKRFKPEET